MNEKKIGIPWQIDSVKPFKEVTLKSRDLVSVFDIEIRNDMVNMGNFYGKDVLQYIYDIADFIPIRQKLQIKMMLDAKK